MIKFPSAIILLLLLLNCIVANSEGAMSHIRGNNFQGEVQLGQEFLRLNIVEYVKGEIYFSDIANADLEKELGRYLIFRNVDELFAEMSSNKNLKISNDDTLLIPIEVTYREKEYKLNIEVPLSKRTFECEAEKIENLFKLIKKMNQQKERAQYFFPQLIHFTGDHTNQKYPMFQKSENSRRITMLGTDQHFIYNHFDVIPRKGVVYFKVKIIESSSNYIFLGICGKNIKSSPNVYLDPNFMGLYLNNGNLYGAKMNSPGAKGLIIEGEPVFKVEIDMNKKVITWYMNDAIIHLAQIWKNLVDKDFHPMVTLYSKGDTVQFLNN